MTTTDWIIDIALILIVVRQMREERFTLRFVALPLGIVAFVAHTYLHSLPTSGNDLALIVGSLAVGTALGVVGGLITRVRGADGEAYVQAGPAAATLWILSMSARLGFILWITHSAGEAALGRFSIAHHITSAERLADGARAARTLRGHLPDRHHRGPRPCAPAPPQPATSTAQQLVSA